MLGGKLIVLEVADAVVMMWWLSLPTVELQNSQVVVKGCETPGYVIVSAARARITSYRHIPIWRQGQLRSKSTWNGDVDCMQVNLICVIF